MHTKTLNLHSNSKRQEVMAKKKNQSRKIELANKSAVASMRFQTHFGLKQMGCEDGGLFHELADAEINYIAELGLTDDILSIKNLVEGIKRDLDTEPTVKKGDFCTSVVAIALGIARIPDLNEMLIPISWQDQISKKVLTIYYPEASRNAAVDWAKANGYNTSTYLGHPVVKFKQLFIIIDRTRSLT